MIIDFHFRYAQNRTVDLQITRTKLLKPPKKETKPGEQDEAAILGPDTSNSNTSSVTDKASFGLSGKRNNSPKNDSWPPIILIPFFSTCLNWYFASGGFKLL